MKKTLFSILLSGVVVFAFAQTEEIAIKNVLNEETKAFYDRDAHKMVSYWHQTPQTTMYIIISPAHVIDTRGASFNADSIQKNMLGGEPLKIDFHRENWIFCINDNSAYVTFDQISNDTQAKQYTHETRFMEKINGSWKIVSSNVVFVDR
jgi:hypothetical protein